MIPIITAIFSGLFGLGKSILGFKEAQTEAVKGALDVVKSIDNNDATSTAALANALQQILTQGSWLEKNWRSWLMVLLIVIIGCVFFGHVPPHFNDPLSPMAERCFSLLEIGLGGYIARRGIVDVVRMFNIGSILKTLINKKVL
jgi:hypothetical protein